MYHICTYQNKIINTATGTDKLGASNATSTGYYLRKFFHEDPAGKYVVSGVNYRMQRFKLEDRVFTSKNYYWPLVTSEITNFPSLIQSPNW